MQGYSLLYIHVQVCVAEVTLHESVNEDNYFKQTGETYTSLNTFREVAGVNTSKSPITCKKYQNHHLVINNRQQSIKVQQTYSGTHCALEKLKDNM